MRNLANAAKRYVRLRVVVNLVLKRVQTPWVARAILLIFEARFPVNPIYCTTDGSPVAGGAS